MKNIELYKIFDNFMGGSICIFGHWFGRPGDNYHRPKGFLYEDNIFKIIFDGDEILTIHDPKKIGIKKTSLIIEKASHVIFEWFYYGRPKLKENKFFHDYKYISNKIIYESNADWYKYTPNFNGKEIAVSIT